nr:coat protein 2 [Bellflower vein chlorosis virus]
SSATLSNLAGIESFESIVAADKWSTTSPTNLLELTVHPTACHVKDGLVTQTSLSVVSSLFNRWRGSIKYRIIFGASMFVKGKMAVSAVPVVFRNRKMSVEEICAFPCLICDLSSQNREFTFEVPYVSIGTDSYVVRDALYDTSSYSAKFVVSRLHFVVLDPLVMNANASNSVSFIVTQSPGKDFQLSQLSGVKAEFVDRRLKPQ